MSDKKNPEPETTTARMSPENVKKVMLALSKAETYFVVAANKDDHTCTIVGDGNLLTDSLVDMMVKNSVVVPLLKVALSKYAVLMMEEGDIDNLFRLYNDQQLDD